MISTSIGEKQYVVYSEKEFNQLLNSSLLRDLVLIGMPKDSKEYTMDNGKKLIMSTDKRDDLLMQDSEGVVLAVGEKVKTLNISDRVVFHYLLLNTGRDTPDGSVFTFMWNDKLYLLVSESQLYFKICDGEYHSLNGWFLVDGVKNDVEKIDLSVGHVSGRILTGGIVDLAKQEYKTDRCEIVCAPEWSKFKKGDVVMTHGTWDVPIKSDTMRKKEKRYFRCQDWNLVCHEEFIESKTS